MRRRLTRAFTLLELLAAVTLLVLLGSMLFEIFGKSSEVVNISNARQEVFQYARAALEFIERELIGAFTSADAQPNAADGIKGLRVYHTASMSITDEEGNAVRRRQDSQGIFLSTGIMARDVSGSPEDSAPDHNPYFGHDVNCARIAYYLNGEPTDEAGSPLYRQLEHAAVYRTEMYKLSFANPTQGNPFIRNCLFFNVHVMSRFLQEQYTEFVAMDWNSDDVVRVGSFDRRRGLPQALFIQMRITDVSHAKLYDWDAAGKRWYVPGPIAGKDYAGKDDPVVQTFSQIVYYGRRSD